MSEVLEDKLKKLIEESRASINWTEVNKWIAVGEPYEEHEEILMFMNQNGVADSRSDEEENILMEKLFTEIPGRLIKRPGQRAILELPQPPEVRNINIVIKLLDPSMFPIQSRNTEQMLNNLSNSNLLDNVIGLNVRGRVRNMIDHAGSENAAANQKVIKSYYDFGKAVSECHNYYIREKKKWIPAAQRLVKEEIRKQIPMKITVDFKVKLR
ncbi:1831_t:CDS:2 [Entrophospora sp. SA101]|nr:13178_t:CDS:2 [Entrophospora sp. SA101]CAJ0757976.1 1831_t:CDS:2 [Entrophospora sp. SA101]